MANLFRNLELQAFRAGITPRSQESREWFRKRASRLRRINRTALMKEQELVKSPRHIIGSMQMFFYDPKHKETLPYYDTFPLSIIIGPAEGGFMGLNLHYLPPMLRAKFLDGLIELADSKVYDDDTKFRLKYGMLKKAAKFKYYKPCVKHYLSSNVRSRFSTVPAPEWEIATFLPTAKWNKASSSTVYSASRRMI
tara:strand:+ start:12295 stop:12879 length:585 start_codon:yes stop_codon:yes gene_type:complete